MEPPEKRNANSNDRPAPCQGHFPNYFISTSKSRQVLIFHLVIINQATLPQVGLGHRILSEECNTHPYLPRSP